MSQHLFLLGKGGRTDLNALACTRDSYRAIEEALLPAVLLRSLIRPKTSC